MTRSASGFYEQGEELTPVPTVRVGVGFGPGKVVAFAAVLDTGSDVCIFPEESFRGMTLGEPAALLEVRPFGATPFGAPARLPSVTAGDLRETAVISVLVPGADPVIGRSFLNRCRLELDARSGLVRLETE